MADEKRTKNCSKAGEPAGNIARSRASAKRALVLIAVHLLFLLHLAHYAYTGRTLSPLEPSEGMELGKRSLLNAGAIFFGLAILATLIFGRFFCGWGCHLVALQDLARAWLLKLGLRPRPLRSRWLALVPLIAFLYMFVWPFAYRVWIGALLGPLTVETSTEDFWRTFPGLGVALLTFAICGFAIVYLLGSKGFCTYACPYGAIFGLSDRLAPGRIRVTDACEGCGHCSATCSSNVAVAKEVRTFGMVVDPGCMKCLDCVSVCPKEALYFGFGKPALLARARGPKAAPDPSLGWREEAIAGAFFVLAFLTFRGLYARIPFLLSLGIASSLAFLGLLAWRLLARKPARLPGLELVRESQLTRSGQTTLALLLLFLPVWGHCAYVRYHAWRMESLFEQLGPAREAWFGNPPQRELSPSSDFLQLREHAERVREIGWLDDPRASYALAWCALAEGKPQQFLAESERALVGGLLRADLHQNRAHIHRAAGEMQLAEREWRRTLELAPQSPAAWSGLAEVLALRGERAAAQALLEQALEMHPESARLQHDLAVVHMLGGQVEAAQNALEGALRSDPALHEARLKLVSLHQSRANFGAAEELLLSGIAAYPKARELHQAWLAQLAGQGDRARLRSALEQAQTLFPGDAGLAALARELSGPP